ncbi:thymidylate kinase [Sphingomonas sp. Leaf407]|uniref:dTMP kinase n=1 Tax=unclassified Sphingomonas TaxID=196159 RepID=UPI0006FD8834|nr:MULTISPECIES: dTMP kinase [unclassified Sphingomonas]KQN36831.1 thymidylate kinase [Sphingomonas sp. Leaf42]KQT30258.1 thymidylate kinase [Sphingomonas sp. Leaf407]
MSAGRFLTLEGGEGVGKSTQARALVAALEARGLHAVLTREPGGSEGAEAIRDLLMQGDVRRWSAHAEALLFAAARADHVEKVIRPLVDAGSWVVCDRFLDSTRAYQGAQGIDDAAILALHAFGSRGLLPDRTLLLTLPEGQGDARAKARDGDAADRFAARDSDFHRSVVATFDRIAASESDRVRRIDASGAPDTVTARLMEALADLLP